MRLLDTADQERLSSILEPLDRPAGELREHADEGLLGVPMHLEPETAAEVRRDHPDSRLADAERLGEMEAERMRILDRPVERQRAVLLPDGHVSTRLDRLGREPVDANLVLDHVIDPAKRGFDVALDERHGDDECCRPRPRRCGASRPSSPRRYRARGSGTS